MVQKGVPIGGRPNLTTTLAGMSAGEFNERKFWSLLISLTRFFATKFFWLGASNDGKTELLLKRLRLSPLLLRLSPPLLRSKRHSFRFGQCGFLHC